MSLQDIRNARTEMKTKTIWDAYFKQRSNEIKEEEKKNKKQTNPLTKDKKK